LASCTEDKNPYPADEPIKKSLRQPGFVFCGANVCGDGGAAPVGYKMISDKGWNFQPSDRACAAARPPLMFVWPRPQLSWIEHLPSK
jgi:hypothetical protein